MSDLKKCPMPNCPGPVQRYNSFVKCEHCGLTAPDATWPDIPRVSSDAQEVARETPPDARVAKLEGALRTYRDTCKHGAILAETWDETQNEFWNLGRWEAGVREQATQDRETIASLRLTVHDLKRDGERGYLLDRDTLGKQWHAALERAETAEHERDEARSHPHRRHLQTRAEQAERERDTLRARVEELETHECGQCGASMDSPWHSPTLRIVTVFPPPDAPQETRKERLARHGFDAARPKEGCADALGFPRRDAPQETRAELPVCPKCGKPPVSATGIFPGLVKCPSGCIGAVDEGKWARRTAENTPCRECGGMPEWSNGFIYHSCLYPRPEGWLHTCTPAEWIARNTKGEEDETTTEKMRQRVRQATGPAESGDLSGVPGQNHADAGEACQGGKAVATPDKRREALERAGASFTDGDALRFTVAHLLDWAALVNAALDGKEQGG